MTRISKRTIIYLIYFAFIMIFACGCNAEGPFSTDVDELKKTIENSNIPLEETDNGISVNQDENLIVVGVSQLGSESSWRTANTDSIQNALTPENGYFMMFNNARQKQENQIKAIRSFISQGVDYIVFAPVIEDGWETVLKEAKDADIPVILMDRGVDKKSEDLYTARVGSNTREEGEKAGKWLENELEKERRADEEINIAVIQGTTGSSSQRGRSIGFDVISDTHPNWKIVTRVDGDFTTSKGKEAMEQILPIFDDLDVLICQNDDMAMGALEVIEKAGKSTGINGDVILISFDATKEALKLVKDGVINVDVECNPEQGEYVSEIIKKLEAGEEVEKLNYVDEKVFTIDNVDDYIDDRTY